MTNLDKNDARQGETGHNVRYILIASVGLAVVALAIVAFLVA